MAADPEVMSNHASGRASQGDGQAGSPTRWWRDGWRTGNPFVPILLLAAAVWFLVGVQTARLWQERSLLNAAWEAQADAFEQSKLLRGQLDGVAAETARMARRGNPNAAKVVQELGKLGITIDPDAKPAPIPE